jgi:WD40 repeat protein
MKKCLLLVLLSMITTLCYTMETSLTNNVHVKSNRFPKNKRKKLAMLKEKVKEKGKEKAHVKKDYELDEKTRLWFLQRAKRAGITDTFDFHEEYFSPDHELMLIKGVMGNFINFLKFTTPKMAGEFNYFKNVKGLPKLAINLPVKYAKKPNKRKLQNVIINHLTNRYTKRPSDIVELLSLANIAIEHSDNKYEEIVAKLIRQACCKFIAHQALQKAELSAFQIKFRHAYDGPGKPARNFEATRLQGFDYIFNKDDFNTARTSPAAECKKSYDWLLSLKLSKKDSNMVAEEILAIEFDERSSGATTLKDKSFSLNTETINKFTALAFFPKFQTFLLGDSKGRLYSNGYSNFYPYRFESEHQKAIRTLAACGVLFAAGSDDRNIGIYSALAKAPKRIFTGHTAPVSSVSFENDENILVSGSEDKTMRLWDVATGHCIYTNHRLNPITNVTYSTNDRLIAACSGDSVTFYDSRTPGVIEELKYPSPTITAEFSQDCKKLLVACAASWLEKSGIQLLDLRTGKYSHNYTFNENIADAHLSPQNHVLTRTHKGNVLLTALGDYNAECGYDLKVYRFNDDSNTELCGMSDDGNTIITIKNYKKCWTHSHLESAADSYYSYLSAWTEYCDANNGRIRLHQLYNEKNKPKNKFKAEEALTARYLDMVYKQGRKGELNSANPMLQTAFLNNIQTHLEKN